MDMRSVNTSSCRGGFLPKVNRSPHLAAGDRCLRPVFSQAHRTLQAPCSCTGNEAGYAVHLGVVVSLDYHAIIPSQPAESGVDLSDKLGFYPSNGKQHTNKCQYP